MLASDFISLVDHPRPSSDGFTARCPAHEDNKNSLSFRDGDKGLVIKCFAGCEVEDVCQSVGIEMTELFEEERQQDRPSIEAEYVYRDENGNPCIKVTRKRPKAFFQSHIENGDWVPGLNGHKRFPYRLPEILENKSQKTVFLVEGEKDADTLASLGLQSTTTLGGSSSWKSEYAEYFRGAKRVVILPDNDSAGHSYAQAAAADLIPVAKDVKIIDLPDLPEKGDVSDWVAAGGTKKQLLEIVKRQSMMTKERMEIMSSEELSTLPDSEVRWAVPGLLAEGLAILIGGPKVGKSYLALEFATAISYERPALGSIPCPPGETIYFALEDTFQSVKRRLDSVVGYGSDRCFFSTKLGKFGDSSWKDLGSWLGEHPDCRLVIVDTLVQIKPSPRRGMSNANAYEIDSVIGAEMRKWAQENRVCLLALHHLSKQSGAGGMSGEASGSMGIPGAADTMMKLDRDMNAETGRLSYNSRFCQSGGRLLWFDTDAERWMEGTPGHSTGWKSRLKNIAEKEESITTAEWAAAANLSLATARKQLTRAVNQGWLIRVTDGVFRPAVEVAEKEESYG